MKNKKFDPSMGGQMYEALKGITGLTNQKREQVEAVESKSSIKYENLSTERLIGILNEHGTRIWANQKIIRILQKNQNATKTIQELLKVLENSPEKEDSSQKIDLLAKSGLKDEIKRRLEKFDYHEFVTKMNKIVESLKQEIIKNVEQTYKPSQGDIGFVFTMINATYLSLKMEVDSILVNPIVRQNLNSLLENIFGKGKAVYGLLLEKVRKHKEQWNFKQLKYSKENLQFEINTQKEDLTSYVDNMLTHFQNLIFENVANWREDFNATTVSEPKLSLEHSQAKMDNQMFDTNILPGLRNFVIQEQAMSLQKEFLNIWKILKNQHYDQVLRDGETRQDFAKNIDKNLETQEESKKILEQANQVLFGYINNDGKYPAKRNEIVVKWLAGEKINPPSLLIQAQLVKSLKNLLSLNLDYFNNLVNKVLQDFNQQIKNNPDEYKAEKSDFDALLKFWPQVHNDKNLRKLSINDQQGILDDLINRNWNSAKKKFSALLLMQDVGQKHSDTIKMSSTKKEKKGTASIEEKKETFVPLKKVMQKEGPKNEMEDVLSLLEYINTPLYNKIFILLGNEMLTKVNKKREDFSWEDAVKIMDTNDRGFFKGLLKHLLDLQFRIDELGTKLKIKDTQILVDLENKYYENLLNLFKYEPEKNRLTFDGMIRNKINKMNQLYFKKLFQLLKFDLKTISSLELKNIVKNNGAIIEESLDKILQKASGKQSEMKA